MDNSRRLFLLMSLTGFGLGSTRAADDFADFDALVRERSQRFDNLVEKAFSRFDQKVKQAYKRAGLEYEPEWGDVSEEYLPAPKYWVGYDKTDDSRIKLDYDKAEMTVEVLVKQDLSDEDTSQTLKKVAIKYAEMDSNTINAIDPIRAHLSINQSQSDVPKEQDLSPLLHLISNTDVQAIDIPDQVDKELDVAILKKTSQTGKLNKKKVSIKIPFKQNVEEKGIQTLKPHVMAMAQKYKISPALIFAIIKNESAFNPKAISPIPAYGLMQLVPSSGGLDAYNLVFGKNVKPKPEELFSSTFNITLGTAYLHILMYRYLKGVQSLDNRTLCTISAYNTGAGNVAKTFTGKRYVKNALPYINKLEIESLYNQLVSGLPYEETRKYLKKVRRSMKHYESYNF